MRIGIDAGPIFSDRAGVGWHTYHLLHALLRLKEDVEFVGYARPAALRHYADAADLQDLLHHERIRWVAAGKWAFRGQGTRDRLDLFHGPNFKMQTIGRYGGVLTIHDLWLDRHPEYSGKFLGQRWSRMRTRRAALKARTVITISNYSAHDIVDLYGLPMDRIAVIPNGVSADFWPVSGTEAASVLRRLGVDGQRYILFVGGPHPRKNHRLLLKAYAARRDRFRAWKIVVVGGCSDRFGDVAEHAREQGIEDRLICAGRVSIADLRALYSAADVMVFPSLYEGFGLPVLEAMACGTPVIASNATSLPEVAGDAAALIDPRSPEDMAGALVRVLDDPAYAGVLREKGRARARQFSWDHAAQQTFEVYRAACGVRR